MEPITNNLWVAALVAAILIVLTAIVMVAIKARNRRQEETAREFRRRLTKLGRCPEHGTVKARLRTPEVGAPWVCPYTGCGRLVLLNDFADTGAGGVRPAPTEREQPYPDVPPLPGA